jgi:hypothetical protein
VAEFDALLAQNYGIIRPEKAKGNRTFTTLDGLQQAKVKVQDRETFGPELQVAKRILDEIIRDRAEGADSLLVALVNQAFKVDKEGMVDRASLNAIRRLDIDDARWPDLCRAIDESRRTIGAKRYVTFHERQDSDERWQMVPLDHAAIEPGPEVFQEPSPRQQLAKARDLIGPLLRALGDENTDDLEAVVFAEQLADALGIDPECAIKAAEAA